MGKKVAIFIFLIIILLFLIFIIREFIVWNNLGLDKTNTMGRSEVIELVKKGTSYSNYYLSPESNPPATEEPLKADIYIKDNVMAYYINSQLTEWTDYNTGERIFISKSGDATTATIANDAKKQENTQYGVDYSEFLDENFEYKYLGEKDFSGRKAIVIQLKNGSNVKKYTIDKETGLIMEIEEFYKKYLFISFKTVVNENIKLDVVQEENVARPDLTNDVVEKAS